MCYAICGIVHIKDPMLLSMLLGKSSTCSGNSKFYVLLHVWFFTICPVPYISRFFCLLTFQAYTVDPRSIQALLLKASSLLDLKKLHDAILHYLEAVRLAPHQFEAYSGMLLHNLKQIKTNKVKKKENSI